jgi:RNA polymerase sigma factor (sigma-70 family)
MHVAASARHACNPELKRGYKKGEDPVASQDNSSLPDLIMAATSGVGQAQVDLRKKVEPALRRWAGAILPGLGCNQQLHIEEVVEAAWHNIYIRLPKLDVPYALFRYGHITVRRGALRHIRRCEKLISLESLLQASDDESGEETIPLVPAELRDEGDSVTMGRLSDEILHIAKKIDPQFRKMLEPRFGEDLSLKEIAKRIEESYGNTRTRYSRWLIQLRAIVLNSDEMTRLLIEKKKKEKRKKKKQPDDPEDESFREDP